MPGPAIPLEELVTGYPRLAGNMELYPETAIFRRFGALNARNILYLQAELQYLEKKLHQKEQFDNGRTGTSSKFARDWFWLDNSLRVNEGDGDGEQYELVKRIREVLSAYNNALIQQATILGYSEPDQWDLNDVQTYLETRDMGPFIFDAEDGRIWGSLNEPKSCCPDLITLRPRHSEDSFSQWATDKFISLLFACKCHRGKKMSRRYGAVGFKDKKLLRVTFWITNIIAALLPIASIATLYCVQTILARLALIALFNLIVSICLMAFTTAKRTDMFAVSAAFSAVQVVFVATSTPSASPGVGPH